MFTQSKAISWAFDINKQNTNPQQLTDFVSFWWNISRGVRTALCVPEYIESGVLHVVCVESIVACRALWRFMFRPMSSSRSRFDLQALLHVFPAVTDCAWLTLIGGLFQTFLYHRSCVKTKFISRRNSPSSIRYANKPSNRSFDIWAVNVRTTLVASLCSFQDTTQPDL